MPDIVLTTLNAKFIHAAFGLRYLFANLGALQPRLVHLVDMNQTRFAAPARRPMRRFDLMARSASYVRSWRPPPSESLRLTPSTAS